MGLTGRWRRATTVAAAAGLVALSLGWSTAGVLAAKSSGCEGGGFSVLGQSGTVDTTVASPPATFTVQGKYNRFDVVASTFEVRDYKFLPTTNPLDMTNGVVTPVWEYKRPLHGGTLTSAVSVSLSGENVVLTRTGRVASGAALTMKIQAADCAAGGIFQMEVQRADIDPATGLPRKTIFVHKLADVAGIVRPFFFDNQNFRDRIGQFVTADANGNTVNCTPSADNRFCVQVTQRTNVGNDNSPKFVGRDSPQGGPAPNNTVRIAHPECGSPQVPTIDHCGGVAVWLVASGGRMGFVTGEDGVEVAPPSSQCTQNCQAQDRVRGRLAVLGFPFPVAADDRLTPRLCTPVRADCPL